MSIELAGVVLTGISAISSLVQAYKTALDLGRDMTEEEMDDVLTEVTTPSASAEALSAVITDDVLGDILDNINQEKDRLRDTIRDKQKTRAKKRRVMDEVDSNICFELETIKRYNNGVLPDIQNPDLYELWDQHGCR